MRRLLPFLVVVLSAAACGGGGEEPIDPASLTTCQAVADAAIGVIQDSIDIVDAASLTGEEPDPEAVAGVEELGSALEARASELSCGEAEMAERMAGLAEGLEADSVFGQLIIEGLLTGGEGFFDEG